MTAESDGGLDRVARSRRNIRKSRRVEACPECEGRSIRRSKVGGINRMGPCETCRGTGLMLK